MKIQILEDNRYLKLNEHNTFYDELKKLVECEIVTRLDYGVASYFLAFDLYNLDYFDKELLARTILLSVPSPSLYERLSKYKVAGAIESRVYFGNHASIIGLEKVIDFNIFKEGIYYTLEDFGYSNFIKKNREENYNLANMVVDYLKMHQDYFSKNTSL